MTAHLSMSVQHHDDERPGRSGLGLAVVLALFLAMGVLVIGHGSVAASSTSACVADGTLIYGSTDCSGR